MRLNLERIGAIHDLIHDHRWSGVELAAEARRRTAVLARHCRARDDRFVIAHANSPSFFADLFAVWEVGACAVCINPGLSAGELANVVDFIRPRAVLVHDGTAVEAVVPVIDTDKELAPEQLPTPTGGLDDPALMLFTSGTTGDPKGVLHSQRSILSRLALNQAFIGTESLARSLCVLPTHFGHGLIGNCLTPLFAGGDLLLMHGAGVAGAAGLGEVLDRHQVSFMSSVPAFWKLALRVSRPPQTSRPARVQIGSAPLSAELWQAVMQWSGAGEVVNMYGITETANWVGGASSRDFAPEDGLLGTPWGGQLAVLDEDGRIQASGAGEVLLQTPSLMSGYYRRDDLSAEVLRAGWYHTGDTGRIDEQGVLRMTGRNRYAINRGGIKIYPEELDLLLERHDAVLEACAFAIQDPISGENVAAAVKLRDDLRAGASPTDTQLIDWLRARIRPEALPARLFLIADIPKTDRGKLNRDHVAKHCLTAANQPRGASS